MRLTRSMASQQTLSKKIILGFAAISSAAVVGTVGLVGAAPSNQDNNQMRKDFCNHWMDHKFKNHGDCVSDWNKKHNHGHGGGHGYHPGDHNVSANVGVNVSGHHNNVFVNVWNYFF